MFVCVCVCACMRAFCKAICACICIHTRYIIIGASRLNYEGIWSSATQGASGHVCVFRILISTTDLS